MDNITFYYDGALKPIFKDVTVSIDPAWRLGIVGRNGIGKSTFLSIVSGELEPQRGTVKLPEYVSVFPVNIENPDRCVRDIIKSLIGPFREIEESLAQLAGKTDACSLHRYGELAEAYAFYRGYEIDALIEKEITQLYLEFELLDRPYMELSGGERTKIQLAALFLRPQHYLLIDEPTNHLDIIGRAEVADYLRRKRGFALVSHDQAFVDECCNHIMEINKAGVSIEKGNYSSWALNKRQFESFELNKKEKLAKEIVQLERASKQARGYSSAKEKEKRGSYDKGFVGARAARLMKRAKNIESRREQKIDAVKSLLQTYEPIRSLEIKQEDLLVHNYMRLHEVDFSYPGNLILEDITFDIEKGDRIWIRGGNGSGKTTLLRILSGELIPTSGFVHKAIDLKISTAYQEMPVVRGMVSDYLKACGTSITGFVRMLDYFNMGIEYLDRRIETLSEGERKKLDIARAFSSSAPLYIWDEPLNYMDYHFRVQLEEAVLKYRPTVIFVEHDRSFAEKIATKIIDL